MTSQEMMKATCGPGDWFVNVSGVGDAPNWVAQIKPHEDSGLLFGYKPAELLAKQYRHKDTSMTATRTPKEQTK